MEVDFKIIRAYVFLYSNRRDISNTKVVKSFSRGNNIFFLKFK